MARDKGDAVRGYGLSLMVVLVVGVSVSGAVAQELPPVPQVGVTAPKSGATFQSLATQALQADDAANPAQLWVGQGAALWTQPVGSNGKACADCHGDVAQGMTGVAAGYPKVDAASGRLLNLEARINACRTEQQGAAALADETDALLGLTALVSLQSRGQPRTVTITGTAQPFFEQGRSFYQSRQGQLNLACGQCHDDNVGRKLRGDTISQGQTQGWPAYRLEWQRIGSLHRRLRACSLGVRAEVLDYGAPEYVALELYLAWRGGGLPMESPGVRR